MIGFIILVVGISAWLACTVACIEIAKENDMNVGGWALMGFLFSIIGLAICLVCSDSAKAKKEARDDRPMFEVRPTRPNASIPLRNEKHNW